MDLSKRWWLNQSTHSKVANSTSSRFLQGMRFRIVPTCSQITISSYGEAVGTAEVADGVSIEEADWPPFSSGPATEASPNTAMQLARS